MLEYQYNCEIKRLRDTNLFQPDKHTIPGEFIPFRKATETEAPKARPHYQQPHYSTASPMPLEDHTYGFPQAPKKRKMKENTLEESYTETITVLKEINHTVDVRLKDIADEIRGLKDAIISNRFDEQLSLGYFCKFFVGDNLFVLSIINTYILYNLVFVCIKNRKYKKART